MSVYHMSGVAEREANLLESKALLTREIAACIETIESSDRSAKEKENAVAEIHRATVAHANFLESTIAQENLSGAADNERWRISRADTALSFLNLCSCIFGKLTEWSEVLGFPTHHYRPGKTSLAELQRLVAETYPNHADALWQKFEKEGLPVHGFQTPLSRAQSSIAMALPPEVQFREGTTQVTDEKNTLEAKATIEREVKDGGKSETVEVEQGPSTTKIGKWFEHTRGSQKKKIQKLSDGGGRKVAIRLSIAIVGIAIVGAVISVSSGSPTGHSDAPENSDRGALLTLSNAADSINSPIVAPIARSPEPASAPSSSEIAPAASSSSELASVSAVQPIELFVTPIPISGNEVMVVAEVHNNSTQQFVGTLEAKIVDPQKSWSLSSSDAKGRWTHEVLLNPNERMFESVTMKVDFRIPVLLNARYRVDVAVVERDGNRRASYLVDCEASANSCSSGMFEKKEALDRWDAYLHKNGNP